MQKPTLTVTSVTITSPNPRQLATFYARLLNRPVTTDEPPTPEDPPTAGWAQLRPTPKEPNEPKEPTLNFEYEAAWQRPIWPAEQGSQNATQHLDIHVADLTAATEHAVAAGATLADTQPQQGVRVLIDPDGHPFCLFE